MDHGGEMTGPLGSVVPAAGDARHRRPATSSSRRGVPARAASARGVLGDGRVGSTDRIWFAALLGAAALAGCDLGSAAKPADKPDMVTVADAASPPDLASAPAPDLAQAPPDLASRAVGASFNDPQLAARELNYGLALRTASLKLVGDLPTSDEQTQLAAAGDPKGFYRQRVTAYLADPRFARQMIAYFRNTFRTGGSFQGLPPLDTAPTFAAELVVNDRPFTDVLTAPNGTCPTFNNGAFVPADCGNGAPTAGVLTDPGVQALYYSNMAFRRTRWVQETFACNKFPAEYRNQPVPMGGGLYTSPWDFNSISGTPVNFKDTTTLVCANCHSTINHVAPLFGGFDVNGVFHNSIQVTTPINGLPTTQPTDWLPNGEPTAWRDGVPAADLPTLGKAIAQDPAFATCMVTRVYDWVMSKDDVVIDSATVPDEVIAPYRDAFVNDGYNLRAVMSMAFTSDDFVLF